MPFVGIILRKVSIPFAWFSAKALTAPAVISLTEYKCRRVGSSARYDGFGLAGVVARVLATAARIDRDAAGLLSIGLVSR